VLSLWNNLGYALANANQAVEARRAFEHAAGAAARAPVFAADALDGLAKLEVAHDPTRATELLRRSLALREASEGPEHPDLGVTLNNLADTLRLQHDCREALPLYDRALTLMRKLGPNHPHVAAVRAGRELCTSAK
jgi:hypothetical protein